jgi:hypothetical protein
VLFPRQDFSHSTPQVQVTPKYPSHKAKNQQYIDETMTYCIQQPQKRNGDDTANESPTYIFKRPQRPFAVVDYHYDALHKNDDQQKQAKNIMADQKQVSRALKTFDYRYITPTNAQSATYKDATSPNMWYQEWQAKPKDFAPSRPLNLLNEPLYIDMATHTRKASRVRLNHWDRDMEPDGTFVQRLQREKEITRRNNATQKTIQGVKREDTKRAAQRAEVVDLTVDDGV